mmetsp:Transcript_13053/g.28618  ORF Transcript_13053/g.28618 Transcript_13053/m.28618 type:complete len:287 (-) Transcript_13053:2092-2952(-)
MGFLATCNSSPLSIPRPCALLEVSSSFPALSLITCLAQSISGILLRISMSGTSASISIDLSVPSGRASLTLLRSFRMSTTKSSPSRKPKSLAVRLDLSPTPSSLPSLSRRTCCAAETPVSFSILALIFFAVSLAAISTGTFFPSGSVTFIVMDFASTCIVSDSVNPSSPRVLFFDNSLPLIFKICLLVPMPVSFLIFFLISSTVSVGLSLSDTWSPLGMSSWICMDLRSTLNTAPSVIPQSTASFLLLSSSLPSLNSFMLFAGIPDALSSCCLISPMVSPIGSTIT